MLYLLKCVFSALRPNLIFSFESYISTLFPYRPILLTDLDFASFFAKAMVRDGFEIDSSPCDRVPVFYVTDLVPAELGSMITACR